MQKLTIGKEPTYFFEEVDIDEKFGYPIYCNNICVGGVFYKIFSINNNKHLELNGLEIKKEYRRKGFATLVVEILKSMSDVIIGGITEKSAIPFWHAMGGEMKEFPIAIMPLMGIKPAECFISFFIGDNKEIIELYKKKLKNYPDYIIEK